MSERATIVLNVNGAAFDTSAVGYDTLLTVIRDQLFLTGTKRGCNQGVAALCTVLSDSRPVRSCLSLALDCEDKLIDTIEGLSRPPAHAGAAGPSIAGGAFQCGFCTPGMLVAAFALLMNNRRPSEADIRRTLSGNLCRCTGYKKIIEAVLGAAHALQDGDRR